MKGLVIGGEFGNILIREKSGESFELGELFVAEDGKNKILLQVFDLLYGSQLTQQHVELISGIQLEEDADLQVFEPHLRHYVLAKAKNVLALHSNNAVTAKNLPKVFSTVRQLAKEDLSFLENPQSPLAFGSIRSGSTALPVPIVLHGDKVLSHHMLITGTTGRGKSVFMINLLWNLLDKDYCGTLVFDPHNEYYAGFNGKGLKDHPAAQTNVVYYTTKNPPPGARTIKIPLERLKPHHFDGSADWSEPQREALQAAYRKWSQDWIPQILVAENMDKFHEGTLGVIKRRLMQLLHIDVDENGVHCKGLFDLVQGETTIQDIVNDITNRKTVVIDTSELPGNTEILIASIFARSLLENYKSYSLAELRDKPVVSIVLEEAPRVLGKEVLEKGPNVFSTIAREGRKFKVGLVAITQLPSLIPRTVLANLNTKVIFGTELKPERVAIIESASQDLSQDDRTIASLDKGEALVTSTFTKFALPIKIPRFETLLTKEKEPSKVEFSGIKVQ